MTYQARQADLTGGAANFFLVIPPPVGVAAGKAGGASSVIMADEGAGGLVRYCWSDSMYVYRITRVRYGTSLERLQIHKGTDREVRWVDVRRQNVELKRISPATEGDRWRERERGMLNNGFSPS